jgi:polysaccharide export outer membrane protein
MHMYCIFVVSVVITMRVMAPTALLAQVQSAPTAVNAGKAVPEGYVIGPEDILSIVFWRDAEMTGEHPVRPDGMITLPLVGDLRAAGLTPAELKAAIETATERLITDANVTIAVRQINSRKVFITGQVAAPGAYQLTRPLTVMQLIALAGGLLEYADSNNITTLRTVDGKQVGRKFRYKDVAKGKGLEQNIELRPGDTVVVP